jgi:hypothetical protein
LANVIEIIIRAKDQTGPAIKQAATGLNGLKDGFGKIPAAIQGAAAAIGPFGVATLAAGTAITAATIATKSFLDTVKGGADAGDALNRIAEQTGLTVEQVSRLKFAATQSNTSIESLNTGIRFLSRNLFEAQRGGKEQTETLRELGFSGKEAEGNLGGTSSALLKISDRLKQVEDPGTRTALAMRLFGRSAQEIVPFLAQGSDSIKKLGDEADAAGITVTTAAGKLGDAFNDSLLKIDQQFTGLKTRIAEAALPALIRFTEAASSGLAKVADIVESNKALFESLATVIERVATIGINITVKGIEFLDSVIAKLKAIAQNPIVATGIGLAVAANPALRAAAGVGTALGAPGPRPLEIHKGARAEPKPGPIGPTDDDLKRQKQAIEAQEKFTEALRESFLVSQALGEGLREALGPDKAAGAIRGLQAALSDLEAPVGVTVEGKKALDTLTAQIAATEFAISVELDADKLSDLKRELEKLEERAARVGSGLRGIPPAPVLAIRGAAAEEREPVELVTDVDRTSAAIAQVVEQLEQAGVNGEYLRDVLAESGETAFLFAAGFESAFAAFADRLDPLKNFMSDMSQAAFEVADGISNAIGGAFEDLVVKGHKFIDALGAFAKTLGQLAINFLAQITQAIAKALVLKAILGSIGGFGIVGTIVNSIASAATGGQVAGAARGGSVPALASGGSIRGAASPPSPSPVRRMPGLSLGGSMAAAGVVALALGGSISPTYQPRAYLNEGGSIASSSTLPAPSQGTTDPLRRVHLAQGGSIAPDDPVRRVRLALGGSIAPAHARTTGAVTPRVHLNAGGQIVGGTTHGPTITSTYAPSFSSQVHLSDGGAIVHAAQGVRVIPGNAQAFDSVPAMLSPGEVVLPTIGGRSPGDLLAGLEALGKDVRMMMARNFVPTAPMGAGAGVTTVNVNTIDADGFRTFVRRGGLAREQSLADDPARD